VVGIRRKSLGVEAVAAERALRAQAEGIALRRIRQRVPAGGDGDEPRNALRVRHGVAMGELGAAGESGKVDWCGVIGPGEVLDTGVENPVGTLAIVAAAEALIAGMVVLREVRCQQRAAEADRTGAGARGHGPRRAARSRGRTPAVG
jgi:hypothetical protein